MTLPTPYTCLNWLCLSQIPRREPSFWLALLTHFQLTIQELVQLPSEQLKSMGLVDSEIAAIRIDNPIVEKTKSWLHKNTDCSIIGYEHEDYPQLLKQLDSPPLVLFCKGNTKLLQAAQIAIVGSRKSTIQGANIARQFGLELGERGITVTSGLALGIDGAAHQGAYDTKGKTVAVLGGGLDYIHPRSHLNLAKNIVEANGCIISEFAPWVTVKPYHFPRRNRIIAGLSKGVLVVESRIKSGSMITANLAAEFSRDVFAIPGNIYNPLSEGPNLLIQQGAKLTTGVMDIVIEFSDIPDLREYQPEIDSDNLLPDNAGGVVLEFVEPEVTSIDDLCTRSKLTVSEVMTQLLQLEMSGWVKALPGGYVRVK